MIYIMVYGYRDAPIANPEPAMFFLKELPTRHMVESYAGRHGVDPDKIASALTIMRRASVMIRRIEAYFAGHGLSQLRFLFLMIIDREPDRDTLSVGEIAARLDVAGPVVTRTLRALIEDQLVTSGKDPDDARTKRIGLTEAGRARLAEVLPGYFANLADEMTEETTTEMERNS